MKTARFVLKIVSASLALAAAICCVIAFWDKITECISFAKGRVKGDPDAADYDDDWDE